MPSRVGLPGELVMESPEGDRLAPEQSPSSSERSSGQNAVACSPHTTPCMQPRGGMPGSVQGVSTFSIHMQGTSPGDSRPSGVLVAGSLGSDNDMHQAHQSPARKDKRSPAGDQHGDRESRESLYELAAEPLASAMSPTGFEPMSPVTDFLRHRASLRSGLGSKEHEGGSHIMGAPTSTVFAYDDAAKNDSRLLVVMLPLLLSVVAMFAVLLWYQSVAFDEADNRSDASRAAQQVLQQQSNLRLLCEAYVGSLARGNTELYYTIVPEARLGLTELHRLSLDALFQGMGEEEHHSAAEAFQVLVNETTGLGGTAAGAVESCRLYSEALSRLGIALVRGLRTLEVGGSLAQEVTTLLGLATAADAASALWLARAFHTVADSGSGTAELHSTVEELTVHWEAQHDFVRMLAPRWSMPRRDLLRDLEGNRTASHELGEGVRELMRRLRAVAAEIDAQGESLKREGTIGVTCTCILVVLVFGFTAAMIRFLLGGIAEQATLQQSEIEQRQELEKSVAHFVPTEFLALLRYRSLIQVTVGHRVPVEVAIMFTDIRNFTGFALTMTSQATFNWLNRFFGVMNPVIRQHSGFVDKYMGDGIMALFAGAADAVAASCHMQTALAGFNQSELALDPSAWFIRMGIGLHFGRVCAGTVGTRDRLVTTIVSGHVVLCCSVESLCKPYGANILATGAVVGAVNMEGVGYRRVGKVKKGAEVFDLFDVWEADQPLDRAHKQTVEQDWDEALAAFENRQFAVALKVFERLAEVALEAKDPRCALENAALHKAATCKRFLVEPPLPSWRGEEV